MSPEELNIRKAVIKAECALMARITQSCSLLGLLKVIKDEGKRLEKEFDELKDILKD